MPDDSLLAMTLQLAVPLEIDRLRAYTETQRAAIATECAKIVAAGGDHLMFRSKVPGESAKAFNALARGLAVAAYGPDGVTFAGLHWSAP